MRERTTSISLIFLFFLSSPLLISGFFAGSPFDNLVDQIDSLTNFAESQLIEPIVLERQGEDQNGNKFFEKEVIITNSDQISDIPVSRLFVNPNSIVDYFEPSIQVQKKSSVLPIQGLSEPQGPVLQIDLVPNQNIQEDIIDQIKGRIAEKNIFDDLIESIIESNSEPVQNTPHLFPSPVEADRILSEINEHEKANKFDNLFNAEPTLTIEKPKTSIFDDIRQKWNDKTERSWDDDEDDDDDDEDDDDDDDTDPKWAEIRSRALERITNMREKIHDLLSNFRNGLQPLQLNEHTKELEDLELQYRKQKQERQKAKVLEHFNQQQQKAADFNPFEKFYIVSNGDESQFIQPQIINIPNGGYLTNESPESSEKHKDVLEKIKEKLDKKDQEFLKTINSENIEKKSHDSEIFADSARLSAINENQNNFIHIILNKNVDRVEAEDLLSYIANLTSVPSKWIKEIKINGNLVTFTIEDNKIDLDSLISQINAFGEKITKEKGLTVISCNRGNNPDIAVSDRTLKIDTRSKDFFLATILTCASVLFILVVLLAIFVIRRRGYLRRKLVDNLSPRKPVIDDEERLVKDEKTNKCKFQIGSVWPFSKVMKNQDMSPSQDYQELCRQRMQSKSTPMSSTLCTDINSPTTPAAGISSTPIRVNSNEGKSSESSRSSTSSWSEEPINVCNMDITTGHVILSYIEEHLNDKDRLNKEWESLYNYEAEPNDTDIGALPQNMTKNRYSNVLPYDHNRVKLGPKGKEVENDYINGSFITDDDPKHPAYIATQGPLIHTSSDFWQMVWEQKSVIIVTLCRTVEYGSMKCNQYWPINGFEVYDKYEVHLVSEHVWCEDYLVRSFYLKNLETNESRTVTQFHYLTWPENSTPQSIKSILDFRRKVNKSFKTKACPMIVHCNDGIGRTGTYIMIDMILNKVVKGAKEINLSATCEFLRDQRPGMVKSKTQFEYSFAVITEEVQNMLKSISQS